MCQGTLPLWMPLSCDGVHCRCKCLCHVSGYISVMMPMSCDGVHCRYEYLNFSALLVHTCFSPHELYGFWWLIMIITLWCRLDYSCGPHLLKALKLTFRLEVLVPLWCLRGCRLQMAWKCSDIRVTQVNVCRDLKKMPCLYLAAVIASVQMARGCSEVVAECHLSSLWRSRGNSPRFALSGIHSPASPSPHY